MDLTLHTETLARLEKDDRYLAAFIFELTDPFIKVIVDGDNCINLSHLSVNGTPMGISFVSFGQFEDALKQRSQENKRPSMLDQILVVFDKTGKLKELQDKYAAHLPRPVEQKDYQMIRFTLLWADNKIRYAIANNDLLSANLSMHTNINDLLKVHYSLHRKWSKNDKRMLADLCVWDVPMSAMLQEYLTETDTPKKYTIWSRMLDHTLQPIGGRFETLANNCDCPTCTNDLHMLAAG
ncbi:MAG: hypothetical protein V4539_01150 [Bacteroidota bacterium]